MLKFDVVGIKAVDTSDPNNKDVAKQVLSVTVAGGAATVVEFADQDAHDPVSNDAFIGNAGDSVEASLTYVDGSGNASQPRTETVTLTDTIAPDQPGDFGVQVTGQV